MMLLESFVSGAHFTHREGMGEDLQMFSPCAKEAGSQKKQKENAFCLLVFESKGKKYS